jgi:large subunit ribosomal protein L15
VKAKKHNEKKIGLGDLKPASGSRHAVKRLGRGTSSGRGRTCCRGHKGQKSRSGGVKRPGFEGGQTPLYRRLPKINRFSNYLFKREYSVLNLSDLKKFKDGVSVKKLIDAGLLKEGARLKILGDGEISGSITVEAHAFSGSAKKKIEAAGGKTVKI